MLDLILKNARLPQGTADIGIAGGRIAALGRDLGPSREVRDIEHRAVLPGLVEAHIHLDKAGFAFDVATVSGGHSTYANGGTGGVVGQFGDGSIANSYNYGNVTLGEGLVCNDLGGVIGRDMKKSAAQVENVYYLDSSCANASTSGADERVTAVSAANCWPGVR